MDLTTHNQVTRMQEKQADLLAHMYTLDVGDSSLDVFNQTYELTVSYLLEYHPLGEDAPVMDIDQDMAEVFRNVYKSEHGFHLRNATYKYAKMYLERRRKEQQEH